ncbi:MAG: protein kinase [Pseudomonadota bacterium]
MRECPKCHGVYQDGETVCARDGAALLPRAPFTPAPSVLVPSRAPAVGVALQPSPSLPSPAAVAAPQRQTSDRVLRGRYALVRPIGEGGFGIVYEGRDLRLQKRVAVKILAPHLASRPDTLARFQREAIAASQIGEKSIVDVTDFDRDDDGTTFIVMEFIEGVELGDLLEKKGPMPMMRAANVAIQIAQALAIAHRKGILHRDLKPSNVFLTSVGVVQDFVKILDFGISKVLFSDEQPQKLTNTGQLMGTPYYMAPEQATGEANVDGGVDIYALGCILFELVAGQPPFVGGNTWTIISQHMMTQPPSLVDLREYEHGLVELDALIAKALAKKRPDRYATMDDFANALREWLAVVASGSGIAANQAQAQAQSLALGVAPHSAAPIATAGFPAVVRAGSAAVPLPNAAMAAMVGAESTSAANSAMTTAASVAGAPSALGASAGMATGVGAAVGAGAVGAGAGALAEEVGMAAGAPAPASSPIPRRRLPTAALVGAGIAALGIATMVVLWSARSPDADQTAPAGESGSSPVTAVSPSSGSGQTAAVPPSGSPTAGVPPAGGGHAAGAPNAAVPGGSASLPATTAVESTAAGESTVEIRLRTSPPEAQVTLDGVLTADNPLRLRRSSGTHTLVVTAPGRKSTTREVGTEVSGDVIIDLEPVSVAVPSPAPNAGRKTDRQQKPQQQRSTKANRGLMVRDL